MSRFNCAVYGCPNTYQNTHGKEPKVRFFSFPTKQRWHDKLRRQTWIRFVSRKNIDNSDWQPTLNSRICSEHFLGNTKSNDRNHPSYNPTIHPVKSKTIKIKDASRYDRLLARNKRISSLTTTQKQSLSSVQPMKFKPFEHSFKDAFVQSNLSMLVYGENSIKFGKMTMFLSNITPTEAETQVNHEDVDILCPQFRSICIGTEEEDQKKEELKMKEIEMSQNRKSINFNGFPSVNNNNKIQKLTSVSEQCFFTLLDMLHDFKPRAQSKEDLLLAFLLKLKFGLPFRALAILFNMKSSTLNYNFYAILELLYVRTQRCTFWPNREKIQETLPECFKKEVPNMLSALKLAYSNNCKKIKNVN